MPATDIRYAGRMLSSVDDTYMGYHSQLKENERLVFLVDSKLNHSGHAMHRAEYIDTVEEYRDNANWWRANGYYTIGVYAV